MSNESPADRLEDVVGMLWKSQQMDGDWAVKQVKAAQAALRSMGWVSVEDRLPENKQMTLVVFHNPRWAKPPHVTPSNYYDNTWTVDDEYVTHWMPLPPPPTGKQT